MDKGECPRSLCSFVHIRSTPRGDASMKAVTEKSRDGIYLRGQTTIRQPVASAPVDWLACVPHSAQSLSGSVVERRESCA